MPLTRELLLFQVRMSLTTSSVSLTVGIGGVTFISVRATSSVYPALFRMFQLTGTNTAVAPSVKLGVYARSNNDSDKFSVNFR